MKFLTLSLSLGAPFLRHFHTLPSFDIITTALRQVAKLLFIYNCCTLLQIIVQHIIMQPLISKISKWIFPALN